MCAKLFLGSGDGRGEVGWGGEEGFADHTFKSKGVHSALLH